MATQRNLSVSIACEVCGGFFSPFYGREETSRFCSRICNGIGQSRDRQASRDFWASVAIGSEDECWPWTGAKNHAGYGILRHGSGSTRATRVALRLSGLDVPKHLVVAHSCDNPCCCNPKHLRATSQRENALDASRRRRRKTTITEDQVRKIMDRGAGYLKYKEAALKFGVSEATIIAIRSGKTWNWLPST